MKHETIEKNVGLLMLLMAYNTWRTVRVADEKLALNNASLA